MHPPPRPRGIPASPIIPPPLCPDMPGPAGPDEFALGTAGFRTASGSPGGRWALPPPWRSLGIPGVGVRRLSENFLATPTPTFAELRIRLRQYKVRRATLPSPPLTMELKPRVDAGDASHALDADDGCRIVQGVDGHWRGRHLVTQVRGYPWLPLSGGLLPGRPENQFPGPGNQ